MRALISKIEVLALHLPPGLAIHICIVVGKQVVYGFICYISMKQLF